jgi:hypothetical protein
MRRLGSHWPLRDDAQKCQRTEKGPVRHAPSRLCIKALDHGLADLVGASRGAHATRERQQVVGVRRLDVGVGLDRLDGKARGGEQARKLPHDMRRMGTRGSDQWDSV